MKRHTARLPVKALTAAFPIVLSIAGCTPVDRWHAFEVDFQKRLAAQPEHRVEVPAELKPQFDGASQAAQENDNNHTPDMPALEDGSLTLSIEQATLMALGSNRDLRVRQLNPVISGAFEMIERGVYDPELFADASVSKETASVTSSATREQFSVESRDTQVTTGIRQFLPTGTSIEATTNLDRSDSNRSPEQQELRFGLTVTQSLLRGFGPAVNLVSIRQAQLETLASTYELRGFTESLLAETEIAYWNFVLAREEIAIFERSLDIAKRQLDEIEQQIQVGLMPQTEAAAARAEVALREQALINARSELDAQRVRLLRLINAADPSRDTDTTSGPSPSELDIQLRATTDPRITPEAIDDLNDRLALAGAMRPDLNEARLRLQQDRLETIVTRNGLLPRLELFITLGRSGFSDTPSDAFKQLDQDTEDFRTGISLTQPLGNRTAKGRDLAARANRQRAAAAITNLRQFIESEVRIAAIELERIRRQIQATHATRTLQEQTVRAERERYDVGASTSLLVAQAQRDLLQSEIAEVEAIVQYRIALVNLYLAEGSLLERRGIHLAGTPTQTLGTIKVN